jgi:hypothetical protein
MVWSGAFRNAASCKSVSKLTYRDIPPAEYVDTGTPYGYYYNWTCVSTYATELCPAPWRVPSIQDFAALITTEDGDPAREVRTRWGYPGICDTKNCDYDNSWGLFWCTECFGVCPAALVYALHVMPDRLWNTYRPASDGLQLRCVK